MRVTIEWTVETTIDPYNSKKEYRSSRARMTGIRCKSKKKEKRVRRLAMQKFALRHRGAETCNPERFTKQEERSIKINFINEFNQFNLNSKFYFISLLCFMSIVILDTAGALRTAKYNTAAAPSVGIRWDSWT